MPKLKDFEQDSNNANQGNKRGQRLILDSIKANGFGRPMFADKNHKLIGGNKSQLAALAALGEDAEVLIIESDGSKPVVHVRTDLDLESDDPQNRARALAYLDNLASYYGFELSIDALRTDLKAGFDFDALPLRKIELDALAGGSLADLLDDGKTTEPPPVSEPEARKAHAKWEARLGDVWQLGQHVIVCGDSLDADLLAEWLPSPPGLIFSDPPYGLDIVSTQGDVGGGESYHRRTGEYYIQSWHGSVASPGPRAMSHKARKNGATAVASRGQYHPVIGDNSTETAAESAALLLGLYPEACHVYWGANHYADKLPASPAWIVWDKDNTANFADCEMAWTNQSKAARIFKHRWNGMLKDSEHGQKRIHPTQKPVALAAWVMANYWESNGPCLDPFLGSGITVLAAEKVGRPVFGFELEPVYISAIIERWHQETGGQTPERIKEGG